MTFTNIPLAVDGALTGASLLRKGLMAAIGGGGVVGANDLKVSATVPNAQSIQISPGMAAVPNGYQTTPDEVYVVSNPTAHTVTSGDMPSASGSLTYWLVCLVVGDPAYDQTGHPFMPSDFDEEQANTFDYVQPVLLACSSTTTTFEELGLDYPGLALARIAIPASTTTITDAMITDVRKIATQRTGVEEDINTGNFALAGGAAAATGLSITLTSPGPLAVYTVELNADVESTSTISAFNINVDGALYSQMITNLNGRAMLHKKVRLTGLAAGSHTISVAAANLSGSTSTLKAGSSLLVERKA